MQQAVGQGLLDDDEELTPVVDMDELDDVPVPDEIQHVVPLVPQRSKLIPQRPSPDNPPLLGVKIPVNI